MANKEMKTAITPLATLYQRESVFPLGTKWIKIPMKRPIA